MHRHVPRSRWSAFRRSIVVLASCAAVLLWAGCSSENPSSERTSPEEEQKTQHEDVQAAKGGDAHKFQSQRPRDTLDAQAQPLLRQGEQAFQRGAYEQALAYLDSAEHHAPTAPVIHYNRGRVYTALNRFEAAQEAFQAALELDPEYPETHLRMGDIEAQRGHLRQALRLYKKEERIAPASDLYVQMGVAYAKLGVADSARWAYEEAIERDSTNANAHMMYGQLLEETGELEAALQHSRKALALEPDRPNYRFAVGSQLYQLGRLEEAAEHLQQAADERLLHYPAQYTLGQVLIRLGREAEAERYQARADSARRLMDRITAAQEAASRNPNTAEHWIQLGELFRRAGEDSRAVMALNRAATLQPRNLSVHNSLGEMMLEAGKTEEAIQRFQAILNTDQTRAETWVNLGLAYARAGNCDEARRAWKTALDHHPGNEAATEYLASSCQPTEQ